VSDEPTLSDFGSSETAAEAEEPADKDTASSEAVDSESAGENATTAERAGDDTEPMGEKTEPTGDGAEATGEETGLSTYAWGNYTCSHCDSETDRVWRADGELVCPECKSW